MANCLKSLLFAIVFFFLGLIFFSQPTYAASDTGWVINDFSAEIVINQDTTVNVKEIIKVDFGFLEKHGIYRTIPVKYKDQFGNNLDIRFKLLKVTDEAGKNYHLAGQTYQEDKIEIKIGHPEITISGPQTYVIEYQVKRVISQPSEEAELYWNVTGHDWPVPIMKASAKVTTPAGAIQDTVCFADYFGESSRNCKDSYTDNLASFTSGRLYPDQGLTIAVALDPKVLSLPSFWQKLGWFLADNLIYSLPLFVFLIISYLYWTRGRDKRYKDIFNESGEIETVPLFEKIDPLMAFGPPEDLSPGEVGLLIDEKVHLQDITAIVIDLARRGFLTIKELPKKGFLAKPDFELTFKGKTEAELHQFERAILDLLFAKKRKKKVKINKLPSSAYKYLDEAKKQLYQHLTKTGYFSGNPKYVRAAYLIIGAVIIGAGAFFLAPFMAAFGINPAGAVFAAITSGMIIIVFSFYMPARTAKGRRALKEVVGLKEWIRLGAWREQIHEKHNFFEEILPYTIAFGLTYKFINAFKKAEIKDLTWYQSTQAINIANFSSSMDSIGNSLNSGVASTRPKSSASKGGSGFSGGGFSGGGFGGGGGGSW